MYINSNNVQINYSNTEKHLLENVKMKFRIDENIIYLIKILFSD
jgi:hypothetical protein